MAVSLYETQPFLHRGEYLTRTKFNVDKDKEKRTHDGIVFDSVLEMRYYRDILCPLVESGDVVNYELQKPYELQPKFVHDGKTVHPVTYVADFYMVFKDGSQKVVDTKGYPDSVALLKRKLFWYHYPEVDYCWMCYTKIDGWCTYEVMKKKRAQRKKEKSKEQKEDFTYGKKGKEDLGE